MKRFIIFIVSISLCLPIVSGKRALLIGVGHYLAGSGWCEINSTNDVELINSVLQKDFVVSILKDNDATFKGIEHSIDKLIQESLPGDTVLIHFSGHGQQVITDSPDEPDGLDEALIPYDAYSNINEHYSGENHFLDDYLSQKLNALRSKVGTKGLVVVTLDACYSGSSHRGPNEDKNAIYRGGADVLGYDLLSPDSQLVVRKKQIIQDETPIEIREAWSDLLIVSACKSNQKNREILIDGMHYGPLSYSMFLSFESTGLNDLKCWLNNIFNFMNSSSPLQTPEVRTTISDLEPTCPSNAEEKTSEGESLEEDTNYIIIATLLSSIILFCMVIWIMKKRK